MKKIVKFIKKNKIKVIISMTLILLAAVLTVSYSYLGNQITESQRTQVNVNLGALENFTFTKGATLNLTPTSPDLSATTTPSVTLISGTDQTTIDSTYNVYFSVLQNGFTYSDNVNKSAELILTITDNTGTEITEVPGLTRVTSGGVTGFDITTYKSFVMIESQVPIATNDTTTGVTHNWTFEVTYIDLPGDQTINSDKTLEAEVIITNSAYKDTINNLILSQNGGAAVIEAKPYNVGKMPTTQELFDAMDNATQINYTVENGMYAAEDDYGTSYFFRGTVSNNWVYFAGYYWRIVRINGDGSVRMIYSGLTPPTEATSEVMTGSGTLLTTSIYFNTKFNSNEYVGYMYTVGEVQGLSTSSNIKTYIDDWYSKNIKYYEKYLADAAFCGDRSLVSGTGIGITTTYYGSTARVGSQIPSGQGVSPTLKCPNKVDNYTVNDEIKGNGALTYPIGLLSADEASLAGSKNGSNHPNYYLYTNSNYWLGSPNYFGGSYASGFYLASSGSMNSYYVNNAYGARPLVSLKSDALAQGTGTWYDPYVIETY